MNVHTEPRQCLTNLFQQETDGGRAEFLEQESRLKHLDLEMPTGDCAVVSLVHATFRPSTGQSYRDCQWELWRFTKPWMYDERRVNEGSPGYVLRRIGQWMRPPNRSPIHGTQSLAMASWLRLLGYEHIYPNEGTKWHCICDNECAYVLDILMPQGHTISVHQRVAYTTAFFDPRDN